jgi:purine-cytosine permease-like protein
VNGLTTTVADALVDTMIGDLAVFCVSTLAIFSHYAVIAMSALFLSLIALGVASRAAAETASIPGFQAFGAFTMGLAITGSLAAGADLASDLGWT